MHRYRQDARRGGVNPSGFNGIRIAQSDASMFDGWSNGLWMGQRLHHVDQIASVSILYWDRRPNQSSAMRRVKDTKNRSREGLRGIMKNCQNV